MRIELDGSAARAIVAAGDARASERGLGRDEGRRAPLVGPLRSPQAAVEAPGGPQARGDHVGHGARAGREVPRGEDARVSGRSALGRGAHGLARRIEQVGEDVGVDRLAEGRDDEVHLQRDRSLLAQAARGVSREVRLGSGKRARAARQRLEIRGFACAAHARAHADQLDARGDASLGARAGQDLDPFALGFGDLARAGRQLGAFLQTRHPHALGAAAAGDARGVDRRAPAPDDEHGARAARRRVAQVGEGADGLGALAGQTELERARRAEGDHDRRVVLEQRLEVEIGAEGAPGMELDAEGQDTLDVALERLARKSVGGNPAAQESAWPLGGVVEVDGVSAQDELVRRREPRGPRSDDPGPQAVRRGAARAVGRLVLLRRPVEDEALEVVHGHRLVELGAHAGGLARGVTHATDRVRQGQLAHDQLERVRVVAGGDVSGVALHAEIERAALCTGSDRRLSALRAVLQHARADQRALVAGIDPLAAALAAARTAAGAAQRRVDGEGWQRRRGRAALGALLGDRAGPLGDDDAQAAVLLRAPEGGDGARQIVRIDGLDAPCAQGPRDGRDVAGRVVRLARGGGGRRRALLEPGHGRDLVVEHDRDHVDLLLGGVEKRRHAGMEEGRVTQEADGALARRAGDTGGEGETRAHAEQGVACVERAPAAEGVAADVVEEVLLRAQRRPRGEEGGTVRAGCAEHGRAHGRRGGELVRRGPRADPEGGVQAGGDHARLVLEGRREVAGALAEHLEREAMELAQGAQMILEVGRKLLDDEDALEGGQTFHELLGREREDDARRQVDDVLLGSGGTQEIGAGRARCSRREDGGAALARLGEPVAGGDQLAGEGEALLDLRAHPARVGRDREEALRSALEAAHLARRDGAQAHGRRRVADAGGRAQHDGQAAALGELECETGRLQRRLGRRRVEHRQVQRIGEVALVLLVGTRQAGRIAGAYDHQTGDGADVGDRAQRIPGGHQAEVLHGDDRARSGEGGGKGHLQGDLLVDRVLEGNPQVRREGREAVAHLGRGRPRVAAGEADSGLDRAAQDGLVAEQQLDPSPLGIQERIERTGAGLHAPILAQEGTLAPG